MHRPGDHGKVFLEVRSALLHEYMYMYRLYYNSYVQLIIISFQKLYFTIDIV